jgi:hypothetical protein
LSIAVASILFAWPNHSVIDATILAPIRSKRCKAVKPCVEPSVLN